jgi:DNA-binding transcriptional ArsR family regulator
MSESNVLLAEVNYIKNKVDSIEKIQILNLRSNHALKEEYVTLFKSEKGLFSVYKAVDGIRTQRDIVSTTALSEATVSRKLSTLFQYGLIEIKAIDGSKKIYQHTVAEKAFGLTKVEIE